MSTSEKTTFLKSKLFSLEKIIFTWFSISLIRVFLETYSSPDPSGYLLNWVGTFIHIPFSFFAIFLSFILLIYAFTKTNILEITNFVTKLLLLIFIPPIADLIINGSKANSIGYITAKPNQFIELFFKLISPFDNPGVTIGMHIASYLILTCIAVFIYKKTHKIILSIFSFLAGYAMLFLYAILPSFAIIPYLSENSLPASTYYAKILESSWIFSHVKIFSPNPNISLTLTNDIFFSQFLWILTVVQLIIIFYFANKQAFNEIKNNLRPERILFWILVSAIGITINQNIFGDINLLNTINLVSLMTFLMLIALNIWLAVMINDEEDVTIDAISNPQRPLVQNKITIKEWHKIQIVLGIFILFGIATMGSMTGFLILISQAAYYLYSSYPLRLKSHFITSSILIGLTAIFIAMSGFYLVSPNQMIEAFPIKAFWIIGFSFALISNFKDIKDFDGDNKENISTLPVVFGLERSKMIISTLFLLIFLMVPLYLKIYQAIPLSILCGFYSYYIFTRKKYREKYIFITIFIYLLILKFLS